MPERVCFRLHIRPEKGEEYVRRHTEVWPEMLEALRRAGWHNYSLFLGDDGTLIGYLECEDFPAAQAAMAATEVRTRMGPSNASDMARPSYDNFGKRAAGARPANWP